MSQIKIENITNIVCKLIGHSWRYKDYSHWMKNCGADYPFKASRKCSRCLQNQYLYGDWTIEDQRSPYDLESDSQSVKHLSNLHPD